MRISSKHVPAGLSFEQRKLWIRAANKALQAGALVEQAIESGNVALRAKPEDDPEGDDKADDENETPKDDPAEETDEEKAKREAAAADKRNRAVMLDSMKRAFSMNGVPQSYDPKTRQCDAVVSIGRAVKRREWWSDTEYEEVLQMTPGSVRLERLNGGAQLLDGHNYYSGLDGILGAVVPGSARIEGNELRCRFQFSESEGGERVARDLQSGLPFLLSTGYKTHKEQIDSTVTPERRTAIDWEPLEVSVVPVSAEGAATGFRSAPSIANGGGVMKTEAQIRAEILAEMEAKAAAEATAKREAEAALKRAADEAERIAQVERTRVAEILKANRTAGLPAEFAEQAVARGDTIDKFRELVLDEMAKRSKETATGGAHQPNAMSGTYDPTSHRVVRDLGAEGMGAAMSEALSIRMLAARRDAPGVTSQAQKEWCERNGHTDLVKHSCRVYDGHEAPRIERAKEFLGMSVVEIAARCIGWKRQILPGNVAEIMTRAFHATGDFSSVFENALNKTLLARYQIAMPTYRRLALQRTFVDFRPHDQIRTGEFPTLEELTETSEIKGGTSVDGKETASVKPYGRRYGISRQTIINDDVGGMDQILASIGDIVMIFENTKFFTLLNSNPTLATDSTAMFHANHLNLASPGGNPSITQISLARKAMRKQTSLSGNTINVAPRILLTGPNQETKADQMLTQITPALVGSVNPFSGKFESVSDANITGDEWYMFAEPSQVPCFVYGFLQGGYGPRVRTDEPFGYQGVQFSVEHDFGVGQIDYRGVYKDEGVGPSGG